MKKIITTDMAPKAIGPYSQAVFADGTLYISGQLPINPETDLMASGIEEQTKQVLENIKAILTEVGYNMDDVVKTTVLLKDINDFAVMNNIYAQYFTTKYPARATYQVACLPKNSLIEIETIAYRKSI